MNRPSIVFEQSKLLIENLKSIRIRSNLSTSRLRNSSNESLKKNYSKPLLKIQPVPAKLALQDILKIYPNTSSNSIIQQESLNIKHNNQHRPKLNLRDTHTTSIIVLETDRLSARDTPIQTIQIDLQRHRPPSRKPVETTQANRKSKSTEMTAGPGQRYGIPVTKVPRSRLGVPEGKENLVMNVNLNDSHAAKKNLVKQERTLRLAFRKNEPKSSAIQTPTASCDPMPSHRELPIPPPKKRELRTKRGLEESVLSKQEIVKLLKNNFVEKKPEEVSKGVAKKGFLETFCPDNSKAFSPSQSQVLQNFEESFKKLQKIEVPRDSNRGARPASAPKQTEGRPTIRRLVLVPKVKEQKMLNVVSGDTVGSALHKSNKSEAESFISMNSKEFAENFRSKMLSRVIKLPLDLSLNAINLTSVTTANAEVKTGDKFKGKSILASLEL